MQIWKICFSHSALLLLEYANGDLFETEDLRITYFLAAANSMWSRSRPEHLGEFKKLVPALAVKQKKHKSSF